MSTKNKDNLSGWVQNILPPLWLYPWTVQPVAGHCTMLSQPHKIPNYRFKSIFHL